MLNTLYTKKIKFHLIVKFILHFWDFFHTALEISLIGELSFKLRQQLKKPNCPFVRLFVCLFVCIKDVFSIATVAICNTWCLDKCHHNNWSLFNVPRNLPFNFAQNWISNSWDIADIKFVVGGWVVVVKSF